MFERDKAACPAEPSMRTENVLFSGREPTNEILERAIGPGRDSANPTG